MKFIALVSRPGNSPTLVDSRRVWNWEIFFNRFTLDSDERFFVNEIATYFEMLGMLWSKGLVDEELVLEWSAVGFYLKKVGAVLVKAREVFDAPRL